MNYSDYYPQPGDILLFYQPRTILGRVNVLLSRSPYYHIGIYDENDTVIESRPRGVVRRSIHGKIGGNTFHIISAPPGIGPLVRQWALSKVGMPYDWFGLGVMFSYVYLHIDLSYQTIKGYTCADFVARAYRQAGCDLFPGRNPASLIPADFVRFLPVTQVAATASRL